MIRVNTEVVDTYRNFIQLKSYIVLICLFPEKQLSFIETKDNKLDGEKPYQTGTRKSSGNGYK